MRSPRLLVPLVVAHLVPAVFGIWFLDVRFFQPPPGLGGDTRWVDALILALVLAVDALAIRLWAGPILAASRPGAGARDPRAARGAAAAALAFPYRVAYSLLPISLVATALALSARVATGSSTDLTVAAGACAIGLTITAVLLGYCAAAVGVAPHLEHLVRPELRGREAVGAKVVLFGLGLAAATLLVLTSVGYASYREDADREYVAAARSILPRAIGSHGARAAAELMWATLSAPTAVFSADGTLLVQAGGFDGRLLASLPVSEAGVEKIEAGWRLWQSGPGVRVMSQLPEAPLRARRRAYLTTSAAVSLALFGAAAIMVFLAARAITLPIRLLGGAMARVAGGDLTPRPPSLSRDELGWLAADFRGMAQGLTALVLDVKSSSRSVEEGMRAMSAIGAKVQEGAQEERAGLTALRGSTDAMQDSVGEVTRGVSALGDHVHVTSAALSDLAAALSVVRHEAGELEARVAEAGEDVNRLAETGKRAQDQLSALGGHVEGARGTLARVTGSLSGLESSAINSQLAAAQAAELTERAGAVVQEAVSGIESVRSAVADAKSRVTLLGRRSDDIDHILDFVGEVAKRTNLLSLNASIIATQAGEHGKPFAVVADQIRELASQISSSTKSIGEIIRAVRDDVAGTARLIDWGDALATDGVAAASRSAGALQEIRAATSRTHESAAAILEAVQVHALSTRDVSSLVQAVSDGTRAVAEAMQMIGKSVAALGGVSRSVGGLADGVSRALEEQSGLGQRQLESLVTIDGRLSDIARAVESHGTATRGVRESIAQLQRSGQKNASAVVELAAVSDKLGLRSRILGERVGKFKIDAG